MSLLSNVIEKLREEKRLTQKKFLEMVKFSAPGYRTALQNNEFKYSVLLRISKVLDVPLSYIINETEKKGDYKIDKTNLSTHDDPSDYLTEKGKKILRENIQLKKTIEDKEMIIKAYKKLYGKL